jgi:hypothetical protein
VPVCGLTVSYHKHYSDISLSERPVSRASSLLSDDETNQRSAPGPSRERNISSDDESIDEQWFCGRCKKEWNEEDDGVRWIVCDRCRTPYHLECTKVVSGRKDRNYFKIVIQKIRFECETCELSD